MPGPIVTRRPATQKQKGMTAPEAPGNLADPLMAQQVAPPLATDESGKTDQEIEGDDTKGGAGKLVFQLPEPEIMPPDDPSDPGKTRISAKGGPSKPLGDDPDQPEDYATGDKTDKAKDETPGEDDPAKGSDNAVQGADKDTLDEADPDKSDEEKEKAVEDKVEGGTDEDGEKEEEEANPDDVDVGDGGLGGDPNLKGPEKEDADEGGKDKDAGEKVDEEVEATEEGKEETDADTATGASQDPGALGGSVQIPDTLTPVVTALKSGAIEVTSLDQVPPGLDPTTAGNEAAKVLGDVQGDAEAQKGLILAATEGAVGQLTATVATQSARLTAGKDNTVKRIAAAFGNARSRVMSGADAAIGQIKGTADKVIAEVEGKAASEASRLEGEIGRVAGEVEAFASSYAAQVGAAVERKAGEIQAAGTQKKKTVDDIVKKLRNQYRFTERDPKALAAAYKALDEGGAKASKKIDDDVATSAAQVRKHKDNLQAQFEAVVKPLAVRIRGLLDGQKEKLSEMAAGVRKNVEAGRDEEIKGIESARDQALGQLDTGEKALTESVEREADAAAAGLTQLGASLSQGLRDAGLQAAEGFCAPFGSLDALASGDVVATPDAMANVFGEVRNLLGGMSPEVAASLAAQLGQLDARVIAQVDAYLSAFDAIGADAETKASELAAKTEELYKGRVAEFNTTMTGLGSRTIEAMVTMVDGILKTAGEIKAEADKAAKGKEKDILDEVDKLTQAAIQQLGAAVASLEKDLKESADKAAADAKRGFWGSLLKGALKLALFAALAVGFVLLFGTGGWALLAAGFLAGALASFIIDGIDDLIHGVADWGRTGFFALIEGIEGGITMLTFGKGKALVAAAKYGGDLVKNATRYSMELLVGAKEFDWGDAGYEALSGVVSGGFAFLGDSKVGDKLNDLGGNLFKRFDASKFSNGLNKVVGQNASGLAGNFTKSVVTSGDAIVNNVAKHHMTAEGRENKANGKGFDYRGMFTEYGAKVVGGTLSQGDRAKAAMNGGEANAKQLSEAALNNANIGQKMATNATGKLADKFVEDGTKATIDLTKPEDKPTPAPTPAATSSSAATSGSTSQRRANQP